MSEKLPARPAAASPTAIVSRENCFIRAPTANRSSRLRKLLGAADSTTSGHVPCTSRSKNGRGIQYKSQANDWYELIQSQTGPCLGATAGIGDYLPTRPNLSYSHCRLPCQSTAPVESR